MLTKELKTKIENNLILVKKDDNWYFIGKRGLLYLELKKENEKWSNSWKYINQKYEKKQLKKWNEKIKFSQSLVLPSKKIVIAIKSNPISDLINKYKKDIVIEILQIKDIFYISYYFLKDESFAELYYQLFKTLPKEFKN